jgi:ABC-type multidrug transport system fused ATPase/permease subunit
MEKATCLSLSDFENAEVYDRLQRAQDQVGYRPFQMYKSILTVISSFVTLISGVAILIIWKWWILFLLLIVPVISTIYSLKIGKREYIVRWKRAATLRKSWYYSFLMTKDINYKEVKFYKLDDYLLSKYKKIFARYLKMDTRIFKIRATITFVCNIVMNLIGDGIILLILFSAFMGQIQIGNLLTYIRSISLTETNFEGILNTMFSMYQDNLYIQQLFEFLDLPETDPVNTSKQIPTLLKTYSLPIHKIEFKNVSFRYPGSDEYALKNVSFVIKKDDSIAIVGGNGSGKTTLIKLLTRLYDIEEGHIFINDKEIKTYPVEKLRSMMSLVFQDFVKYELKLRHNIGFGDVKRINNNNDLLLSAKDAGIDNLVNHMPDKFDTQLGNWFADGQQLSGGQWQKVAIARAFFRKASLYILDEPSSSLDPLAEKEIFDQFFKASKGRIGIFTSHRFSTVKYASNILVFKQGSIIEHGSHDELIKLNGYYKSLYEIQASPFNGMSLIDTPFV